MTNKEKCAINASKDLIPDTGLGEFVEGYTNRRDSINKKILWLLLLPIVGWVLLAVFLILALLGKFLRKTHSVYLYQDGVLWETKSIIGKSEEIIIRYDEIGGIKTSKTRQYSSIYGLVNTYQCTSVLLEICDKDGFSIIQRQFAYQNEHEKEDGYNSLGFGMNAILTTWNKIALDRLNRELNENGFCTFYTTENGKKVSVEVENYFIKSANNYAGAGLKYAFQEGILYIYPSEEDCNSSKKYFTINVNEMYNRDVFLLAINQLLGIG